MNRKQASKQRQNDKCEGNERGLFLLHTGNGKGKTSAAMNMVYRHLSHSKKVAVVQFVKNASDFEDGDRNMLNKLKELGFPVCIHTMGTGFSWNSTDEDADIHAASHAFETALEYMNDEQTKLVLLDEVHIALSLGWIEVETVLEGIQSRNPDTHVISTGRRAPEALIEIADLVTEMKMHKHHITQKIPAQPGIEF